MRKNISITLALLISVSSLIFAIDKTGTTAAKFLTIGIGSRPAGFGNAFVAIADDPTAMYWNPAGISRLKGHEVIVNHNNWFADINIDFSGAVIKISENAAFGANLTMVSMEEIEVTRYGNEDTGETYRAGNLAIGLAYARSLTDKFSIGGNLKLIRESIASNNATGFAIDIGTLFDTPFGFRLGTSISNFGPKMQMSGDDLIIPVDINENLEGNNENTTGNISTDHFDLPLLLRVGISGEKLFPNIGGITWAIDSGHPNDNNSYLNTGLEFSILNGLLLLRTGYRSLYLTDRVSEYSFGLGLSLSKLVSKPINIDYSFESLKFLGATQQLSIRIRL